MIIELCQDDEAVCADVDSVLIARRETALHHAILDVLDESFCGFNWGVAFNHPFEDVQNNARLEFAVAVEKRFKELCGQDARKQ